MTEQPDLQQYLASLERDIKVNGKLFSDFSNLMVEDGISLFPIYIVSGAEIAMGKPFLNKKQHDVRWNYNVSFMEEFVTRGLIQSDKTQTFIKAFGDPSTRGCFFLIIGDAGNFVFVEFE
jgi:hypothetical protein